MTGRLIKFTAATAAVLICLTSCGDKVSLMGADSSGPASDRAVNNGTEILTTSPVEEEETEPETEAFSVDIKKPRDHKIAKKCIIKDFETVLQCPELPTGCEVTSLCQTLNYLGFDVDKETLADEFMPIDFDGSTTMDHAYIGDPKLNDGFGCFPPALVQTADAYFESIDSPCYAENMSDIDLQTLFYQIEEGRPVIAWITIDLVELAPEHRWTTLDGEEMWFSGMQHCVTIYGYDLNKNIIYVADPLKGNMEYDLERFERMFDLLGKKAVIICGDSETEGSYNPHKDYKKSKYLSRNAQEAKKAEEEKEAKKKAEEEAKKAEEDARKAEEEAKKADEEAARAAEEQAAQAARAAEEEAARAAAAAAEEARLAEERARQQVTEEQTSADVTEAPETTADETTTE